MFSSPSSWIVDNCYDCGRYMDVNYRIKRPKDEAVTLCLSCDFKRYYKKYKKRRQAEDAEAQQFLEDQKQAGLRVGLDDRGVP